MSEEEESWKERLANQMLAFHFREHLLRIHEASASPNDEIYALMQEGEALLEE